MLYFWKIKYLSIHQNIQAPTKFPTIAANKALLGNNAITGASVRDDNCQRPQYNKNFFKFLIFTKIKF